MYCRLAWYPHLTYMTPPSRSTGHPCVHTYALHVQVVGLSQLERPIAVGSRAVSEKELAFSEILSDHASGYGRLQGTVSSVPSCHGSTNISAAMYEQVLPLSYLVVPTPTALGSRNTSRGRGGIALQRLWRGRWPKRFLFLFNHTRIQPVICRL
jgi:hypothetical protein